MPLPALDSPQWQNPLRAFAWGMWSSVTSAVLALVLFATSASVRRSIFAGVACGELVMLAGKWWLG